MAEAEAYEALSYRELQGLCKEVGLKASGKKDDLVARLVEHSGSPQIPSTIDSAAAPDDDAVAVADAPAAPPAPVEEEEPEQQQQQQQQQPSPAVAEQEPQQPPAVAVAADVGKRKAPADAEPAEEEAEAAPALKHLKSPGVMLSRRPLPTSGIKPPAVFAPKPAHHHQAPSPVPFPTSNTKPATAATMGGSVRKSVAATTTASHRMSVLSKKPLATGPTPFGPGTYGSANSKGPLVAAAKPTAAAAAPATGAAAGPVVAATASAKAALLKERPKLNYKPHIGKLRPFFSPKPFLVPQHQQQNQQQQQQRKPLGSKVNAANGAAGGATTTAAMMGAGPVMAKPGSTVAAPAPTKQVL